MIPHAKQPQGDPSVDSGVALIIVNGRRSKDSMKYYKQGKKEWSRNVYQEVTVRYTTQPLFEDSSVL